MKDPLTADLSEMSSRLFSYLYFRYGITIIWTAAEAAIWGGTAGQQYDPCYHLACDTYANNNNHALDVNSDAIAYSILQYAMSTADVNGATGGKGNFRLPPPEELPKE